MLLGDQVPDFTAETTEGTLQLYDYIKDVWCLIMSHPGVFTPVCTTELAYMVKEIKQFTDRNVKLIAISFDTKEKHIQWVKDINAFNKEDTSKPLPYPLIADSTRDIGAKLDMIRPADKSQPGLALTARHALLIGPDKKLKCYFVYPATSGRNMDEILRAIDTVQLTHRTGLSSEVNWKPCKRIIVPASLPPEKVQEFVKNRKVVDLPSHQNYLQFGELKN
ncbi:peroxiredoxin-6-like [Rhinoderma darwinii]|uniref:peroxiredoxin-6-like n=1 Tax=Rhinoderma darwinii TaxID=43563 RepID=UPI003F66E4A2